MTKNDLRAELAKAKQAFSKWPEWKQTVLRDSMRGKVVTPRDVSSKNSECGTEAIANGKLQEK